MKFFLWSSDDTDTDAGPGTATGASADADVDVDKKKFVIYTGVYFFDTISSPGLPMWICLPGYFLQYSLTRTRERLSTFLLLGPA